MRIDGNDVRICKECKGEVIEAQTTRKSKGQFVRVLLEVPEIEPDLLSLNVGNQWVVSKIGAKFHAGQPATKNQRAGMLANGVGFHAEHGPTCNKRRASGHR